MSASPKSRVYFELHSGDIEVHRDVVILKGHPFYRPYITAAAVNEDTIAGNGDLGSVMLAQTAPQVSASTGLPTIVESVFIVKDDASPVWDSLKSWLKGTEVSVMETRLPNAQFTSLFRL